MNTLRQAAQQALVALKESHGMVDNMHCYGICVDAIADLKKALEQSEQVTAEAIHATWSAGFVEGEKSALAKPAPHPFVVKHYIYEDRPTIKGNGFDGLEIGVDRKDAEEFIEWVNARISTQCTTRPQQEPFGYFRADAFGWTDCAETDENAKALYEYPFESRQWVGLTEGERNDLEDYCEMIIGKEAFDAIEAKLKERNT